MNQYLPVPNSPKSRHNDAEYNQKSMGDNIIFQP